MNEGDSLTQQGIQYTKKMSCSQKMLFVAGFAKTMHSPSRTRQAVFANGSCLQKMFLLL